MALKPPPAKTEIADAYPLPSNDTARTGFGRLYDFVTSLLGLTGATTDMLAASKILDPAAMYNLSLVPSVSGNALTMTLKSRDGATALAVDNAGTISQRSATAAAGTINSRNITAAVALTVSSGSTLGHTSANAGYIYWYLLDNAGAEELACSTKDFGDSGIVSTTAEGGAGAADSATVMYSATLRNNVPFRLLGRSTDTQVAAGTWLVVPSLIELAPLRRSAAPTIQVFTVNGTYTKTVGVRAAIVIATGGGASGGGASGGSGTAGAGGGGTAGASTIGYFRADQITDSVAVTVGASVAGTVGADGTDGNATSFGSLLTANGGQKGKLMSAGSIPEVSPANNSTPTATGGIMNIRAGMGTQGLRINGTVAIGGAGGASFWSGGVAGGAIALGGIPGTTGGWVAQFGEGGGGAEAAGIGTSAAGGNGAAGVVFVIELY